jgi:SAM-dependent methyltransferase
MTCNACGSAALEQVFEMEPMPLAGSFAATREDALAATKYPLSWHFCTRCGLVNVEPRIDPALIYADYSYRTGDVPGLVRHHADFAKFLAPHGKGKYLEIGGNDGTLIRQLPKWWTKVNVDPSDVARKAWDGGYTLVNESWSSALGYRDNFDLIVSSNSFAHFQGLDDAFDAVREALTPAGQFVVEVHDLRATLISAQWDTVYHEHCAEWSEQALRTAAGLHGLKMVALSRTPLHGGSLRARFQKGKVKPEKPKLPEFSGLRHAYETRNAPSLADGSVAYGAAARATVYLNQVRPNIDYVVDASPRRAGRFVPGTGHQIITPDTFDTLERTIPATLITAWNHAHDIKARHPHYKGQWVTAW